MLPSWTCLQLRIWRCLNFERKSFTLLRPTIRRASSSKLSIAVDVGTYHWQRLQQVWGWWVLLRQGMKSCDAETSQLLLCSFLAWTAQCKVLERTDIPTVPAHCKKSENLSLDLVEFFVYKSLFWIWTSETLVTINEPFKNVFFMKIQPFLALWTNSPTSDFTTS